MSVLHPSDASIDPLSDSGGFSGAGLKLLEETIHSARSAATTPVSELLAPIDPDGAAVRLTEQTCVFDHCAVLLFPRTLPAGLAELERRGLAPLPPTPSTVVRRRVSQRYGLDPADCPISITRLRLDLPDARRHPAVEVFLFPRDAPGFQPRVEWSEAARGFERHTAFELTRPDPDRLVALMAAWRAEAGLLWEGGGHNPYEGGPGGSTVLYFVRESRHPAPRRRFELHCAGDLTTFTAGLPLDSVAVEHAYRTWPVR